MLPGVALSRLLRQNVVKTEAEPYRLSDCLPFGSTLLERRYHSGYILVAVRITQEARDAAVAEHGLMVKHFQNLDVVFPGEDLLKPCPQFIIMLAGGKEIYEPP